MDKRKEPVKSTIKVLGFDAWTGGCHHFQRVFDAFKARGIDLALVHLGSWGGDPGRARSEMIGNLPVNDISNYPGGSFLRVLDVEQPAAVIFLSTDTFAHRALIRYCRLRGIPTIHLFHGLMTVQVVDGNPAYKVNIVGQLKFIADRLGKALTKVWPVYVRSMWLSRAPLRDWLRFIYDILTYAFGKFPLVSADDARTDSCCVYVGTDVAYAKKKYRFGDDAINVVGNPDLIHFGMTADLVAYGLRASLIEKSDVIYVDTGLVFAGRVYDSLDDFVNHLIATKDMLRAQGKRLVFKPHPDYRKTGVAETLLQHDIETCSNEAFISRLMNSCACIVEPSTAALLPALLGLPVFLAAYGKLSGQGYGDVLKSYPRSRLLNDLASFSSDLLAENAAVNAFEVRRWIDTNSGPMPADAMPDRVADVVMALVRNVGREFEHGRLRLSSP